MKINSLFGKVTLKQFFTIPNILCYIRLILIPIFIQVYVDATQVRDYYMAATIIFLSGLTDFADGFIARKFNQVTELGKFIDPLADKLTQASILFALMFKIEGMIILGGIFVIKELSMIVNNYLLFRRGKKLDGAMWFGKISTAVFYFVMFIIILIPELSKVWLHGLMIFSGIFLTLSFIKYNELFFKMLREK